MYTCTCMYVRVCTCTTLYSEDKEAIETIERRQRNTVHSVRYPPAESTGFNLVHGQSFHRRASFEKTSTTCRYKLFHSQSHGRGIAIRLFSNFSPESLEISMHLDETWDTTFATRGGVKLQGMTS